MGRPMTKPRNLRAMSNVIRSCRKVFWMTPFVLGLLLAGCRNAQLFPG